MSIRTGDAVFIRSGIPATVKDREPLSGKLVLEQDQQKVRGDARHGYLNGMSQETRSELYGILDAVKGETEDPGERVEKLRVKLGEIEEDPHKLNLARYLRAEMTHIMNTYQIRPREFTIHESKVR